MCLNRDSTLVLLHTAAIPECGINFDADGAHRLDGALSFVRRDAGSHVPLEATQVIRRSGCYHRIGPRKCKVGWHYSSIDLHVSFAHSPADTLQETASRMGRQGVWEVDFVCLVFRGETEKGDCSVDDRGASHTRLLELLLVDLSGKRPAFAGGAQYYLIILVDDCLRLGWPSFLKRKSDVSVVFPGRWSSLVFWPASMLRVFRPP